MPPDPPALVPGPLLPPPCSVNAPCLSLSPRLGLPSCSLPVNAALLRQPQQSSSYSTSSSRRQQSIGVGVVTVILTAPASAAACISLHAGCCRSNSQTTRTGSFKKTGSPPAGVFWRKSACSGVLQDDGKMPSPPHFLWIWRGGGSPPGCRGPTTRPAAACPQPPRARAWKAVVVELVVADLLPAASSPSVPADGAAGVRGPPARGAPWRGARAAGREEPPGGSSLRRSPRRRRPPPRDPPTRIPRPSACRPGQRHARRCRPLRRVDLAMGGRRRTDLARRAATGLVAPPPSPS
jgi:hypothetical protein